MTHPFANILELDIEVTMMLDRVFLFLSEFLKMLDILEAIFNALHSDDCERLIRFPNSIYSNMVNTREFILRNIKIEKNSKVAK